MLTDPQKIALFRAIQSEALPGILKRGIEYARAGRVLLEREIEMKDGEKELLFRVSPPDRPTAYRVSVWPEDEDCHCNCDEKTEPCSHVVAVVAALKNNQVTTLAESKAAHLYYALVPRKRPAHEIQSQTAGPDLCLMRLTPGFLPFDQPLTRVVGAGQNAIAFTEEDYGIDHLFSAAASRSSNGNTPPLLPIPEERMVQTLKLLAQLGSQLVWSHLGADSIDVRTKRIPLTLVRTQNGITVRPASDPSELRFANGAVLRDGAISPLHQPAGKLPFDLKRVVEFTDAKLPIFLQEVYPWLVRETELIHDPASLPEVVALPPLMNVKVERLPAQNEVTLMPELVYGNPPIAIVGLGGILELVNQKTVTTIPERDRAEEKRLTLLLKQDFYLSLGQVSKVPERDAAPLLKRLETATGITTHLSGHAHQDFKTLPSVAPRFTFKDGKLTPEFGYDVDLDAVLRSYHTGGTMVSVANREGGSVLGGLKGLSGMFELPRGWVKSHLATLTHLAYLEKLPDSVPVQKAHGFLSAELGIETPELPRIETTPPAPIPDSVRALLRDYQKDGITFLTQRKLDLGGALLADEMGLGKTLQCLAVLQPAHLPNLVVCPTSVILAWKKQIEMFFPDLPFVLYTGPDRKSRVPEFKNGTLYLTTHALLRLDAAVLQKQKFDTIVFDEAQAIKNPDSLLAQAASKLSATFRIAVTGTPIENRIDDLWSICQFAAPALLGPRELIQDLSLRGQVLSRAKRLVLRRTKVLVAKELPPRLELEKRCELDPEEKALYQTILSGAQADLAQGSFNSPSILSKLLKLRQACCHPALISKTEAAKLTAGQRLSSKLKLLLSELLEARENGSRSLVFSQWTSFLDLIEPSLKEAGFRYLRLDGATKDREAVVDRFQNSGPDDPIDLMLISLKAGGTGLTLTKADQIYLLDPWWNPATEDQAADRAHRIGQTKTVTIHRLIAEGTLEETLLELQREKRELAKGFLEESGGDAAGDMGGATGLSLTREDLGRLLA